MNQILRYWNTVRYLRPAQFYGRFRHSLPRGGADTRPAPPLRSVHGAPDGWAMPVARPASLVGEDVFRLLNETNSLAEHGWDDPALSKLWRYNLHYFDDWTAAQANTRTDAHIRLMTRWVRENPPGGGTGWEPYPTSLRIVNWIKWALAGNALPADAIQSLAVQARWLERRLETHLLGNHLFANAKALTFAGIFFDGDEAERWLAMGLSILSREMREQVLDDGGHFERSPMYHALTLEDVLDLCNLSRAAGGRMTERWSAIDSERPERLAAMRSWLRAMTHPDGEISFFNDSAMGIAPVPQELERYARRIGLTQLSDQSPLLEHLRPSGYVRVARNDMAAILDVAPVGPDYLPGHAHADTLSFELSVRGHRVFVNSGTSEYATSAERLRQRGTAAHNTVVVNGEDSSEVWSRFRVARRARPFGLEVHAQWPATVRCAHDGYRRLTGRPVHWRQWSFREGGLDVRDEIAGRFDRAEARYHLHPRVHVVHVPGSSRGSSALLRMPDGTAVRVEVEGCQLTLEPTTWHPGFGVVESTKCLVMRFAGAVATTRIDWSFDA